MSFASYQQLLDKIDRWNETFREKHPGWCACRPGCTACCVTGISVLRVESDHIRDWMAKGSKLHLAGRCADTASCALLRQDGRCSIYEARPVICRLWGAPLLLTADAACDWGIFASRSETFSDGSVLTCCDLNGKGDEGLVSLHPSSAVDMQRVTTMLIAINHVYCANRGSPPERRYALSHLASKEASGEAAPKEAVHC